MLAKPQGQLNKSLGLALRTGLALYQKDETDKELMKEETMTC